ncbi:endolytic transglycosylase MltG [Streptococcus pseudoporcinus]|uniref:Endolytic murein transglycosylase n=1 Tax=Streptococcus pseudoporcinus LQ 940-04 TaxID=875093 RepID=G5K8L6_9STRE|nr:endolytic transglycosylase MltG [Streptococcus pseudoporcinus]EFR43870.1 YceG family protein [Streptococcus pseudoporcinus SPIN 20026]EHI65443.1 YceG family protein [Streptococcus pseudoporcinus LQ 940-04]VEF94313.1 aminodeoxychorismate lyase [Streptococcus pseudoporcinus]
MTDIKDDGQQSQKEKSFKEHILAELEKANQIRKEKEEELLHQDLKAEDIKEKEREVAEARQKTVALYKDYQDEMARTSTPSETGSYESLSQNRASERLYKDSEKVPNSQSNDFSETVPFTPITIFDQSEIETGPDNTIVGSSDQDVKDLETEKTTETNHTPLEANQSKSSFEANQVETSKEGGSVRRSTNKRQHRDRVAKKISLVVISSIVLIIALVALIGSVFIYNAINPVDKNDTKYVQVEIPAGSGNKLIGQVLEAKGLIKSGTVFNFYTKFKNFSNFQSGYYNLQKSMSLDEIAKSLQKGGTDKPTKPALGKILIPEGYTIKQISKAITDNVNTKSKKDKTPFKSQEFLDTIQDDSFIKAMVKKYPRLLSSLPKKSDAVYQLEGYLFPATYDYYKETDIKALIEDMLATTDATMAPYYSGIESSGKTVNEVLTLASLVEKEGSTDEDRRDIASVFYNRLQNGMALQSNIAVLYAMNKLGDKTTLAEDAGIDTTIKSPYNVYTNTGLMPGPVDSPGLSAIDATVKPANTDYLYFVANVKTGEVFYAKTYEQHSANVEKYVNKQIQ